MIEVVAVAVASLGVAVCRHLTAREIVKRAHPKDIPAIAHAMYLHHPRGRRCRPGTHGRGVTGPLVAEQRARERAGP